MKDPLSVVFSLEAHHKIVGISAQECSTAESRLDRLLEPFVQDFVKEDVAYDITPPGVCLAALERSSSGDFGYETGGALGAGGGQRSEDLPGSRAFLGFVTT